MQLKRILTALFMVAATLPSQAATINLCDILVGGDSPLTFRERLFNAVGAQRRSGYAPYRLTGIFADPLSAGRIYDLAKTPPDQNSFVYIALYYEPRRRDIYEAVGIMQDDSGNLTQVTDAIAFNTRREIWNQEHPDRFISIAYYNVTGNISREAMFDTWAKKGQLPLSRPKMIFSNGIQIFDEFYHDQEHRLLNLDLPKSAFDANQTLAAFIYEFEMLESVQKMRDLKQVLVELKIAHMKNLEATSQNGDNFAKRGQLKNVYQILQLYMQKSWDRTESTLGKFELPDDAKQLWNEFRRNHPRPSNESVLNVANEYIRRIGLAEPDTSDFTSDLLERNPWDINPFFQPQNNEYRAFPY